MNDITEVALLKLEASLDSSEESVRMFLEHLQSLWGYPMVAFKVERDAAMRCTHVTILVSKNETLAEVISRG